MHAHLRTLMQAPDQLFLTDAGLETMLVFLDGMTLPEFASFVLLENDDGIARLHRYFSNCLDHAARVRRGFVLESPTWRASRDWGARTGHSPEQLAACNRRAIELMHELREAYADAGIPIVISGNIGPRGDAYRPADVHAAHEYQRYHQEQVEVLRDCAVDLVSALTLTNVPEAVGITRAAHAAGLPVVISFTVETDGRLPTGVPLGEAIESVDRETGAAPAYYMINCAHPTHFESALEPAPWLQRIRGIRANASRRSHAELDESTTLDDGDPAELGRQYAALRRRLPHLRVVGGCCGTDHRHIEAIADALAAP